MFTQQCWQQNKFFIFELSALLKPSILQRKKLTLSGNCWRQQPFCCKRAAKSSWTHTACITHVRLPQSVVASVSWAFSSRVLQRGFPGKKEKQAKPKRTMFLPHSSVATHHCCYSSHLEHGRFWNGAAYDVVLLLRYVRQWTNMDWSSLGRERWRNLIWRAGRVSLVWISGLLNSSKASVHCGGNVLRLLGGGRL